MRNIFSAKCFSSLDPNLVADNKKFWQTVKPLFSDKTCQKEIIYLTKNKNVLTQDLEIAKIFNNYFSNVVQTLCNRVDKLPLTRMQSISLIQLLQQ